MRVCYSSSWIYATHLDLVVCHKKFVNIRTCTIVHILIKVESEVLLILIVVGVAQVMTAYVHSSA